MLCLKASFHTAKKLAKGFFVSTGDRLAARMVMKSDPQYSNSSQLEDLEGRVRSGAVGVVAVVLGNRLFVSSIGDCRALLYRCESILF